MKRLDHFDNLCNVFKLIQWVTTSHNESVLFDLLQRDGVLFYL